MSAASVILLELNELTPSLIFRFMEEGRLPHFRRLYDESKVFTTDAGEEGLDLNPWVQWVTVHTGQPLAEHGVRLLGEGSRLESPSLADRISAAGLPVWLCGSMNTPFGADLNGAALPDPWSEAPPQPAALEPYVRFVRHHVAEHTNPDGVLPRRDVLAFLRFMAGHGLSLGTVAAIARQLLAERRRGESWKRVAILDRLQWDLFRWYRRRLRPRFATFFSNSVAHMQHTHWREMEPERFALQPTPEQRARYQHAIRFAYEETDRLVGRFLELAGDETTLIFCTALSQQPEAAWDASGGKCFYRPRKMAELTAFAGVRSPHVFSPVMSEEFWLEFEDEAGAREGEAALGALRVSGEAAFRVSREGRDLYAGCGIHHALAEDARLESGAGEARPFFELLYAADTLKSGVHHPDGLLWIRTPDARHVAHAEKVPLTAIAPTVLGLLDVDVPPTMREKPLV